MSHRKITGRSYASSRLRKFDTDSEEDEKISMNNSNLQDESKEQESWLKTSSDECLAIPEKPTSSDKTRKKSDSSKNTPRKLAQKSLKHSKSSQFNQQDNDDKNLISTNISDHTYYHSSDIDLTKLCHHPPPGKNDLKVLLVHDYLFYMNKNLRLGSSDTQILIEHLCGLTSHECDVTESVKKEYLLRKISDKEISFDNHREVMASSVETSNKSYRLKYIFLNKKADKSSDRSLLVKKEKKLYGEGEDLKGRGRLVSDQQNMDDIWTIDGWKRGTEKKTSSKMKHSLTTPEISPKSEISPPSVLKLVDPKIATRKTSTDTPTGSEEKPKSNTEVKRRNFSITSYLSLQRPAPPTTPPEVQKPLVDDQLCREFLNKSAIETSSPNLHKKVMSKMNSQVESALKTKSLKALDLCVTLRSPLRSIECCDPRAELDLNNNIVGSRRGWSVKEDVNKLLRMKAVKWREVSMNLVDSHCHFEMLFSK